MLSEQNHHVAIRAWEEFGRPLAGSIVGNSPLRQGKFEQKRPESQLQQRDNKEQALERGAEKSGSLKYQILTAFL